MQKSGTLPPLAAMSAIALLVAASCKTAAKVFFTLPSIAFVTAGSTITPDTPLGSVLTEQMTDAAFTALDIAAALAGDLLMFAVLAPLAAGMMLCVLRSACESELPLTGAQRGLSSYGAGGLGYFFATAHNYRRALTLAASMVMRAAIWTAITALPLWAVSERERVLAFTKAYLPAGFPLLPAAVVLSVLISLIGLYVRTRRYAASLIYIDDPSLSLRAAARRSAKLTRGHRAEAAMLELSFILWWAAGFFSLGIVLALYTLPFYLCCRVVFFRHIEAQADLHQAKKEV